MGAFEHFFMMHAVTTISSKGVKPSVKPLVEYLRAGRPFNDSVRSWLLALLSEEGWHGTRLVLKQTRGRPQSAAAFKRDWEAFEFYEYLHNAPITRGLCEQYARIIKAEPLRVVATRSKRKGEYQVAQTTYVIAVGSKRIKLVKGAPLPAKLALSLTANKFNKSYDALRKTVAQIERAKAIR